MTCGIYKIVNTENGKVYIGSSLRIEQRWQEHIRKLERGQHRSRLLQRSWNKYGRSCFVFFIIEHVEHFSLIEREQHWITFFSAYDPNRGFNIAPVAGSNRGIKRTPEVKARISAFLKGKKASIETRARMSAAGIGRVFSPETRAKIAASNTGKRHSEETRAKIIAVQIGKKLSLEHRQKIAASLRGIKRSAETKAKISVLHKGRKRSEESRERMRKAQRSRSLSQAQMEMPL